MGKPPEGGTQPEDDDWDDAEGMEEQGYGQGAEPCNKVEVLGEERQQLDRSVLGANANLVGVENHFQQNDQADVQRK